MFSLVGDNESTSQCKFTVIADQEAIPPRRNTKGLSCRITQELAFGNLSIDSRLLRLIFHGVAIGFL